MVDQLRVYLHRPLRDGDRPRLFAVAVAVIAAGAAVLGCARRRRRPLAAASTIPAARTRSRPRRECAGSAHELGRAARCRSERGRAADAAATHATAAEIAAAKRTARRFIAGYLAFTYDQAPASAIRDIDPRLERELADDPPRVPARERARHPRVRLLQTDGVSPSAASLLALVDDGARTYTLTLELAHTAAGWTVTSVGS